MSWLPGTASTGARRRSRKARAARNSRERARMVRSPLTATRSGASAFSSAASASTTAGSVRRKCRSEMWARRRTGTGRPSAGAAAGWPGWPARIPSDAQWSVQGLASSSAARRCVRHPRRFPALSLHADVAQPVQQRDGLVPVPLRLARVRGVARARGDQVPGGARQLGLLAAPAAPLRPPPAAGRRGAAGCPGAAGSAGAGTGPRAAAPARRAGPPRTRRGDQTAYSDDVSHRFRSKPAICSDRSQPGVPMIPAR